MAYLVLLCLIVAVKVFKKTSPNGKVTVYIGKRDFAQRGDVCDAVEGVVVLDPDYLKGRKVFGQVITTFRYGREEDEVMGLHFYRQLFLAHDQIVPERNQITQISDLQQRLLRKLGSGAYAFSFNLPTNAPMSVTLQPGPNDRGRPLGVEYELRVYVAEDEQQKAHRRSTVNMAIRKIQYAPLTQRERQPTTVVSKGFMLSAGKVELEVVLDKEVYFNDDKINAQVSVSNYSKKSVKNIKILVLQNTEVTLVHGHYSKVVASVECRENCPVLPGASFSKVFHLLPLAAENRDRRGIALDGLLKETDACLASSTLNHEDAIGIIISYVLRVQLYLGPMSGDLIADVPFKLAKPEPEDVYPKLQEKRILDRSKLKKQLSREMSTNLVFEDFQWHRQISEDGGGD
ncbi:arrestin, lateral eye [Ixodes scapularis]|uniref:Arrestin, putative n=1 Tax=Ixodes scapularis TaxID=6945 RepID=B7PMB1_IXOSC|nr:arrestin, lateral eye [Ixodes scapularis]EEC07733.1 arrestin, putative [Ixodes scapularis]|eukprot:XP_002434909.1 arrestin, putative [Ixodes scapularis]